MIGAVVYIIKSENSGIIPFYSGRLLHAAFFHTISNIFPAFSDYLHNNTSKKPFSLSGIFPMFVLRRKGKSGDFFVEKGDKFYFRVAALNKAMFDAIILVPENEKMRIGNVNFTIEKFFISADEHERAGFIQKKDLISEVLTLPDMNSVEFKFISPTTFRFFDRDYPWPLPEYVFGSIAEKWIAWDEEKLLPVTRENIKQIANLTQPTRWKGESVALFQREHRRIFAFTGDFAYSLAALRKEEKQILLTLAEFSNFSGVGRLTSQGLGAVSVKYR